MVPYPIMNLTLNILSILFITSTIMPLIKKESWWIRGFDFPHVQLSIFGLFCLSGWFALGDLSSTFNIFITCAVGIGLIYKIWVMLPYTFLLSPTVPRAKDFSSDKKKSLKILNSNVFMDNTNYAGFRKLVSDEDPDIVFMLETNEAWKNEMNEFMDNIFPHQLLHPLENTYGLLFYSKLPMMDEEVRFLIEEDVPSIVTDLIFEDGSKIKFLGLHPKPPSPTENDESTPRDAELIVAGREARSCTYPVIIAGDMNDVAWSHTTRLFARISGLLDLRMGRGFFNTFHAKYPLLRWPLDHIFVSHHFKLIRMKRLKNFNSDHFPIFAELLIETSREAIENVEHPDKVDIEEANQKVEEATE